MTAERKLLRDLTESMIAYFGTDIARVQHFVKVHAFARLIGEEEKLGERELFVLEAAALVHDIGIRKAEEKYGYNNGKLQEEMGPPEAEKMLTESGFDRECIDRVCYLVGHHHTYRDIDGMDYQILVEADFIVNLCEEEDGTGEAVRNAYERIFRTDFGKKLCRELFGV